MSFVSKFYRAMGIREELLDRSTPILRKLMSKEEIKVANQLVKEGKMEKGISDDKQKTVQYQCVG